MKDEASPSPVNMTELEFWSTGLREFLSKPRKPSHIITVMGHFFIEGLPSDLAVAIGGMESAEDEPVEGRSHRTAESKRLLPLNRKAVRRYCSKLAPEVCSWVVMLVDVLNHLYLQGKKVIGIEVLSEPQRTTLETLIESVEYFVARELEVKTAEELRSDLGRIRFDYSGEPVAIMEDLVAKDVIPCWPKPGQAGIQPASKFVSGPVKEWLENPQSTLLARSHWPERPPKSRVRATDSEWEEIVRAGVERNMMREIPEHEIMRDQGGRLILNGAGAVPKYKEVDGVVKKLQRFISILVPANTYQTHAPGDDTHLPYLGQMSMFQLESGQDVLVDSEDLTSCFNLFLLPEQWGGLMTFSKQVSGAVFGREASQKAWVAMKVVPMGWINSVSLMQTVVRTLVFEESRIPFSSEISKEKHFPAEVSSSLVYLDSYDELRKIQKECKSLLEGTKSERHVRFEETCRRHGLSLNEGKRLIGAVTGSLQGGSFSASEDKLSSLVGYGAMLLSSEKVTEFELRHFAGKALFVLAFRRPAMATLEKIFYDIERCAQAGKALAPSPGTKEEIAMIVTLVPVLRMNLRAALDEEVTITDASPLGAGGGVSSEFKRPPDVEDHDNETCFYCQGALNNNRYPCPSSCRVTLCSLRYARGVRTRCRSLGKGSQERTPL